MQLGELPGRGLSPDAKSRIKTEVRKNLTLALWVETRRATNHWGVLVCRAFNQVVMNWLTNKLRSLRRGDGGALPSCREATRLQSRRWIARCRCESGSGCASI